jgi:hypothetical protein
MSSPLRGFATEYEEPPLALLAPSSVSLRPVDSNNAKDGTWRFSVECAVL